MSSGVISLVALATAAGVVVLALLVSDLVHRVVDGSSDASASPPLALPSGRADDLSQGRSIDVKQFRPSRSEQPEGDLEQAPPDEQGVEGGHAYRQVGDEVAAILTAAEHAAAEIRETAQSEAEETRRSADEQSAATLAEAEARRTEADRYSEQTRAAADAYAAERRRTADEHAARTIFDAEERARMTRTAAEQTMRELEAEATRRRDVLTGRIESILTAFRGATTELEKLLPETERVEPDEALHDALADASHRHLRSYAD